MADKENKENTSRSLQVEGYVENRRAGPGMMKILLFVAMPLMLFQAGLAYFLIHKLLLAPAVPTSPSAAATTGVDVVAGPQTAPGNESRAASDPSEYSLITWQNQRTDQDDTSGETLADDDRRYTYFVKDIIVNPAATAGTRFLNVTLAFEYGRKELYNQLQEQDFRIRDALIGILIAKRIDELDGADDKERLRGEILQAVNRLLSKGKIRRVYFTHFVMQ